MREWAGGHIAIDVQLSNALAVADDGDRWVGVAVAEVRVVVPAG